MTGNASNKLRALVLSALMVLSVFAGTVALSGTAAAANDATGVSVSDTSGIEAGDTVQHQVGFNLTDLNDNNSGQTVTVDIWATGDASIQSTSGVSSNISSSNTNVQSGNLTFTLSPSSSNKNAHVDISDLEIAYPTNENVNLKINVTDSGGANLEKTLAGPISVGTASDTLNHGDTVFQGQYVTRSKDLSPNSEL